MITKLLKDIGTNKPFSFLNSMAADLWVIKVEDGIVKYVDKSGLIRNTSAYTEVYVEGEGRKLKKCRNGSC